MTLDERISLYLDKCPGAASGQDGHGTTFRVVCALVNGFALDAEAAFRHLSVWNGTCSPPWKPRELRHKIEQAGKVSHERQRGHLLGGVNGDSRRPEAVQMAPKLVPVRLTPRKREIRTVRTVFSEPCVTHAHTHMCVNRTSKQPSVPSVNLADDLISVPGCKLGRPVEIEMADDDWRAVAASGLGDESLVQFTLQLFGPGCKVLGTGEEVP